MVKNHRGVHRGGSDEENQTCTVKALDLLEKESINRDSKESGTEDTDEGGNEHPSKEE